ncbi:MAG: lipopolysaccharide biosynthesis protein [Deltaproteobacteria bacterium]|nr:lipopolysaccharide biosynthesis protein [Deltaproteobacteria bacterium]
MSERRSATPAGPRSLDGLTASATWLLVGNGFALGAQWLVAVLLGRFVPAGHVGQYAMGLALCAPVFVFADLQLRTMLSTDSRGDFAFGDYLRLRFALLAVALLVVGGVALLGRHDRASTFVVLAIAAYKVCEGVADILHGRLLQRERMRRCGLSMALKGLLVLALFLAAMWATHNVLVGVGAMVVALVVVMVTIDAPAVRRLATASRTPTGPRGSWSGAARALAKGLPLGLTGFLAAATANVPLWVVERTLGKEDLGYLASMVYISAVGSAAMLSIGQATMPRLALLYSQGNARSFWRIAGTVACLAAVGGVALTLVIAVKGEALLGWLYGPGYAARHHVFTLTALAAATGLVATALGQSVTATRAYRSLVVPYFAVALVVAGASLVLVPRLGLRGAPMALAIANACACGTSLYLLLGKLRISSRGQGPVIPIASVDPTEGTGEQP